FTFSKLITPLLSPQIEPNQSYLIKQMPENPHKYRLSAFLSVIQTPYNYNIIVKYIIAFCGFSYS
ncbi:MAG: hypothetical protein ACLUVX_13085, partial [Lachnospira pectinoschiza]